MHRARSAAGRVAIGAALSFSLYLLAWSGSTTSTTAYAIDATPTPTPTAVMSGAPSTAQTATQQTSDQIASVSQQITQAVQDPSLSVDSKVQLINSLSAQFNQLVAIWQQQLAQITTAPPAVAGLQLTPTPAPTAPVCNTPMCPPQPMNPASPTPRPAADQLEQGG